MLRHTDFIQKFKLALKTHLFWNSIHDTLIYFFTSILTITFDPLVPMWDCLTVEVWNVRIFILFLLLLLPWAIRLYVPVSVRDCTIDYLIETTCIYICALLCFYHVNFYVLIVMSITVKQHELWRTVRDMRLSKCSIIIIPRRQTSYLANNHHIQQTSIISGRQTSYPAEKHHIQQTNIISSRQTSYPADKHNIWQTNIISWRQTSYPADKHHI